MSALSHARSTRTCLGIALVFVYLLASVTHRGAVPAGAFPSGVLALARVAATAAAARAHGECLWTASGPHVEVGSVPPTAAERALGAPVDPVMAPASFDVGLVAVASGKLPDFEPSAAFAVPPPREPRARGPPSGV